MPAAPTPWLAALAVVAPAVAGCAEPEDRSIHWPYLHATIVEPSCATAGCHAPPSPQAGVDLASPSGAYAILTGRVCHEGDPAPPGEPPGNYVFPGEPARSRLVHLLRGDDVAVRMPPDRPLPAAEIELLERWILEGAPCD